MLPLVVMVADPSELSVPDSDILICAEAFPLAWKEAFIPVHTGVVVTLACDLLESSTFLSITFTPTALVTTEAIQPVRIAFDIVPRWSSTKRRSLPRAWLKCEPSTGTVQPISAAASSQGFALDRGGLDGGPLSLLQPLDLEHDLAQQNPAGYARQTSC